MGDPASPSVVEPRQAAAVEETPRLAPLYRVLIHNDDVTPMGFVVHVLMSVFKKNSADAGGIMLEAHNTGLALVVVLPLEQAELRVDQAHALARTEKFPLTLTIEPE